MQGRLVPPEPGRFQSFPRAGWKDEFEYAAAVPIDYIEWIYDAYGEDINPLCSDEGIAALLSLSRRTGVALRAVCADYFMDCPLLRTPQPEIEASARKLIALVRNCGRLGIGRITLPFVDASRIDSDTEADRVVEVLLDICSFAEEAGVEIHLESSLPPDALARLMERLPEATFKVNYDSGNSASLGYRPREEFVAYGSRIGSVHIKDRVLGGGTVPLGHGNVDFDSFFGCLADIQYSGDFTLQVARGAEGQEVSWTRSNLDFVRRFWPIPEEKPWTLA
jgi:hexulose-6-phosphate isomerase